MGVGVLHVCATTLAPHCNGLAHHVLTERWGSFDAMHGGLVTLTSMHSTLVASWAHGMRFTNAVCLHACRLQVMSIRPGMATAATQMVVRMLAGPAVMQLVMHRTQGQAPAMLMERLAKAA